MRLKNDNAKMLISSLAAIALLAVFIFGMAVFSAPRGTAGVIITEILVSNRGAILDEDGSSPDYIELHNTGESSVNLLGWYLSDNSNRPMKWVIPSVVLEPGGYVHFFASGKDRQQSDGIWHTNFQIAGDGTEQVLLTMPDGTVHDRIGPPSGIPNVSYGLLDDFETYAYMTKLTPGEANAAPFFHAPEDIVPETAGLLITEYMTGNDSYIPDDDGMYHDWVEIHNPGTEAVELKGWHLSDNPGRPGKWGFPDDLHILPGEYLTFYCSGLSLPGHVAFRLSGDDEALLLTDYNGIEIDRIELKETPFYASYGRAEAGGEMLEGYFGVPTPGAANHGVPVPAAAEVRWDRPALLIMEYVTNNTFHMDEDGDFPDWIELYNYGNEAIDLSGIYLSDRGMNVNKWRFHDGMRISPGARMVIWLSRKDKPGHAGFALSGNDDGLYIADRHGRVIDSVNVVKLPQNVSAGRDEDNHGRWLFFPRPTPGAANNTAGFTELAGLSAEGWDESGVAGTVTENRLHAARVFADADDIFISAGQLVSLRTDEPGGIIRYTLDGNEPGERSREYAGPLEINGNTVLRARVFAQGKEPGAVLTRTYLTNPKNTGHTIPVITLSSNPAGLFSESHGIYASGVDLDELEFPYQGANFWKDWERAAHFAYYEDGGLRVEADAGIKIFGQWSRALPQKSFSVFFKREYGQNELAYPFFPGISRSLFDALILRNSGQDLPRTKFKDAFIGNSVVDVTNVVAMGARPVVLYINGEYWGVYNLREKINEDYFKINEGIPDDEIDIIKANRNALAGTNTQYVQMVSTLRDMEMNNDEAYAYADANIDLDNWIDYWIAVTYFGNPDTGNIKCYRQQGEGHKWRWILFDQDHGVSPTAFNPFINMLHPEGHGFDHLFSTVIARALMDNDRIRERFVERYAYLLQTVLDAERLLAILDGYAEQLAPEMPAQVSRWRNPASMPSWERNVEQMRVFVRGRGEFMKQHLKSTFKLSDERMAELFP